MTESDYLPMPSNDLVNDLFMRVPMPLCMMMGHELIIARVNISALAFSGYAEDQLIGRPARDVFSEITGIPVATVISEVFESGISRKLSEVPVNFLMRDNSSAYIDVLLEPFRDEFGKVTGVLCVANDVTDLVLSRFELKVSENKYRHLFNTMNQAFYIMEMLHDDNGDIFDYRYLEVNASFEKVSGYSNVIGMTARELMGEHADYWIHEYGKVLTTGVARVVRGFSNKYYESYVFPVGLENQLGVLFFDQTEAYNEKQQMKKYADDLKKEVQVQTRELRESNRELLQFARLTSHDLSEPVRKIETFILRLIDEKDSLSAGQLEYYLQRTLKSVGRIKAMIKGVQEYRSMLNMEFEVEDISLNEIIESIVNDLQDLIDERPVAMSIEPLPKIKGSKMLIRQLFFNMIHNSIKFANHDAGCEIRISGSITTESETDYALIFISDNGIGFNEGENEKIFNTFSRLHSKDEYEGTGLGLSLSRRIAEKHGGTITAAGKENHGSTFCVKLPL